MAIRMIDTGIDGFILRFANRDDIPLILELIRGLAEYEKLAHECIATEDRLRESLFSERPYAEVLVGEYEATPVGFALFFHTFSTFLAKPGIYLEDLFVKPVWRGRGFGGAMLAYLAHIAVHRECGRLEWSVLDWNEEAIRFYERLGATPMDGWTTFRLTGETLQAVSARFGRRPPTSAIDSSSDPS
jgi:GNAT superfamily N-acetyltransferase